MRATTAVEYVAYSVLVAWILGDGFPLAADFDGFPGSSINVKLSNTFWTLCVSVVRYFAVKFLASASYNSKVKHVVSTKLHNIRDPTWMSNLIFYASLCCHLSAWKSVLGLIRLLVSLNPDI